MDLLTQGLLGAALAQAGAKKNEARLAAAAGFVAAIMADADVLISSAQDPLLNIEYHRHFSHSLIFIPLGGLLTALLLWPFLRRRLSFGRLLLFTLLGYATAGLLDACTSYGTHLLWPFDDVRIAWSIIAIVDPVFSLVLLVALGFGLRRCKPTAARIGLVFAGAYLLIGVWQHHRAYEAAIELAGQRGHEVERVLVKPTMANLLLWRSVYQSAGLFHIDAIRIGLFSDNRIYPGTQARRFVPERDKPGLVAGSPLSHDIRRFFILSNDFVAEDPARDNVLIDVRYSMLPTRLAPLWGIDMNLDSANHHARFVTYRDRPGDIRQRYVAMLLGRNLPAE
ncbi:MAG: metal-dependent hydrolase [Gammaproteobacteria bacterium]|nr:metal-dependent hydrolase [Gammaproteobacteria bacterium]